MKDRYTNRMNMMGACIAVAERPEHRAVWDAPSPLAFLADFDAFKTEYASISAAAGAAYAASTGPADAKDLAESTLEDIAYTVARALCIYFKKTGNLTDRAKVNFTKSGIARLRESTLKTTCDLIRDLAAPLIVNTDAVACGITNARVTALTAAITDYDALLSAPRGQIVNRSVLIREIETRIAALMEDLPDLDDLVLQYNDTPAGQNFVAAWQAARNIVDAGHSHTEEETPAPPTPPTP